MHSLSYPIIDNKLKEVWNMKNRDTDQAVRPALLLPLLLLQQPGVELQVVLGYEAIPSVLDVAVLGLLHRDDLRAWEWSLPSPPPPVIQQDLGQDSQGGHQGHHQEQEVHLGSVIS